MDLEKEEDAPDEDLVRNPYLVQLGNNITRARKALGLTHEGVRKRTKTTGTNLFLIETGLRDTRVSSLKALAAALETTPQALLPKADGDEPEQLDFKDPQMVHRAVIKRLSLMAVELDELRDIMKALASQAAGTPD